MLLWTFVVDCLNDLRSAFESLPKPIAGQSDESLQGSTEHSEFLSTAETGRLSGTDPR